MNIQILHKMFRDDDSPSVEGQIRWLQKQGFLQNQIDQAMITMYTDIERGEMPIVFTKTESDANGGEETLKEYRLYNSHPLKPPWKGSPIKSGWDLDQTLLMVAKAARTKDLTTIIKNIEKFEATMKAKWEKGKKKGLFKRLFKGDVS